MTDDSQHRHKPQADTEGAKGTRLQCEEDPSRCGHLPTEALPTSMKPGATSPTAKNCLVGLPRGSTAFADAPTTTYVTNTEDSVVVPS